MGELLKRAAKLNGSSEVICKENDPKPHKLCVVLVKLRIF